MTYIITTRNPSNNKLIIISDDDAPAEFTTYRRVRFEAEGIAICQAWGYDILEAP